MRTEHDHERRRKYFENYSDAYLVETLISYARQLERFRNEGWEFNVEGARDEIVERLETLRLSVIPQPETDTGSV